MSKKISVIFICSVPSFFEHFLRGVIASLADHYEVTLCSNFSGYNIDEYRLGQSRVVNIPIRRRPSVVGDIFTVLRLISLFRREKYDICHSFTPKGGLLAMLSAFYAKVPWRMHTFTGQIWAEKKGVAKIALKACDRLLFKLSHFCLVDSSSQRQYLIEQGVISKDKSAVLGRGSIAGVDCARFRTVNSARAQLVDMFDLPDNAVIFVYLGRINEDKGLRLLGSVFAKVAVRNPLWHLLVVGQQEDPRVAELLRMIPKVRVFPNTNRPELFLAGSDVFVLPSRREGFGCAAIEAAACQTPSIVTNIYGLSDTVIHGVTGLKFELDDPISLENCMTELGGSRSLRNRLGALGRQRAVFYFEKAHLEEQWLNLYNRVSGGLTSSRGR